MALSKRGALEQQYGGFHTEGWVDLLPTSWAPYIQMCRLSPPAGLFLNYFPHVFGMMHAAVIYGHPIHELKRVALILFAGTFFASNANHAWNELVDAHIDAKIDRTKNRPIPRGAITRGAAFFFVVWQSLLAAAFLLCLPRDAAIAAVPTVISSFYYPFAKRHIPAPQFVLGFALSSTAIVGSSATGAPKPWTDPSLLSLVAGLALWIILFDTIYAHQDRESDIKHGVKSTAVWFGSYTKPALSVLFGGMMCLLTLSGWYGNMGSWYYFLVVGGCACSVGSMIALVDLKNPGSCWRWFSQNFWYASFAIIGGLAAEYSSQSGLLPSPKYLKVA